MILEHIASKLILDGISYSHGSRTMKPDAVMAHKLKNRFSKEQIDIFCSEKERSQAKEYGRADLRFAMEVKQCSPKALAIIRKKLPLPTNKTLIRKYGWVHSIPGKVII